MSIFFRIEKIKDGKAQTLQRHRRKIHSNSFDFQASGQPKKQLPN